MWLFSWLMDYITPDIDINECASNPCQNGATCLNEVNQYSCRCAPGYEGNNCQFGKYIDSLVIGKHVESIIN